MIIVPDQKSYDRLVGRIQAQLSIAAKCACVACNSCTCACACRSTGFADNFSF